MKKLLIAMSMAVLAGCMSGKAEFGMTNPTEPFDYVRKHCNARYDKQVMIEAAVYGEFGDYISPIDSAKDCMARHGYPVKGWRQKNGKLTPYPYYDKTLDY